MGRKVRVDLKANESLTIEYPITDSGEPMFAKLYLWYRSCGAFKKVSPPAFKVLGYLLMCADFERLDCYPSLTTIMRETQLAKTTVTRAIKELGQLGLITKHNRQSDTHCAKISNYYTITKPPVGGQKQAGKRVVQQIDHVVQQMDRGGTDRVGGGSPADGLKQEPYNENHITRLRDFDGNFCLNTIKQEQYNENHITRLRDFDGNSCLNTIKKLLKDMGIANAMDRNKYALEIARAGLDDKDVEKAMKIASYEVGLANTRGGRELGGIAGQGGWTTALQKEAMRYARGIINNHIKTGEPVELPAEVEAVGR